MTTRRKLRNVRHTRSRSRQLFAERLEPRMLLHGGSEWPFAAEAGAAAANELPGDFYLPAQRRLAPNEGLLSKPASGDPAQIARDFLFRHAADLGLNSSDLANHVVSGQYTDESSGVTHLYWQQTYGALPVMNADLSISVSARGEVIHVASSFVGNARPAAKPGPRNFYSAPQAYGEFSSDLGLPLDAPSRVIGVDPITPELAMVLSANDTFADVPARLVFVPTPAGLELAWRLDVHDSDYTNWFEALVSAETGEAIYTNDLVSHATYNVFAHPVQSPNHGGRSVVVDPHDAVASPFGWHDTNGVAGAEFTDTRGNNASAQEDTNADDAGGFRPSGGASLDFNFPLDTTQNPANFQAAAATNAFYWVNLLHDIHYRYGFTEAAGNFQVNNYGRGGLGNDPVIVDIQDGDGGSDSFVARPEGQSPRMTLYRRDNPYRDRAFDTDILVHEYGHGVSERLTGGPGNTTALNAKQSKAMGEGWGDWWALMLTQLPSDGKLDAYPLGNYAAGFPNNGPGIRTYPYSFDKTINPLTYNAFNGGAANNESHKAGAIWASALWDMNWLLIEKHGFSADLLHGNAGNNLALQLVMDGLKLQGTNPSFLAGRDAILAADVAFTGGANQTEIWTAFARRGMGFSASDGGGANSITVSEAFDVPGSISGTVFRDDDVNGTQNGAEPGLAGWTVFLDQNNNGVADLATSSTFNSTDTPKAIADRGTTYSNRVISGLSGTIEDINVTVTLAHPYDGELYLTLISPANTPVILANYLGGSGDNFTNTTFDDEAATYISAASAPFTGSFKPYFDLAQLDGRDPNGTWKLRIDDAVSGNVGQLLSWSLQITSGSQEPTTVSDANGRYSFFGLGDGTHHVREVLQPGFTRTSPANGVYDVVISGGQSVGGQNFGNRATAAVPNGATWEDTLSPAIAITPPAGQAITHFKISGITGGTLLQQDGITPIANGQFITVAEGGAGVKFLPAANSNAAGRFDVELSANGNTVLPDTSKATSIISVVPVGDTPQVANSSTLEDTLSAPIAIQRNAADGAEVSHFKISGISGGTLFKSNGVTAIPNGAFITAAEAAAGVRFKPSANSTVAGRFDVESSQNGNTVAAQSGKATSTIAVTAVNDLPTISAIAAQVTLKNKATAPIAFIVGDIETPAGLLTLRGYSSNTALVPHANIVFGGSGANRTVTVTPAANQIGTAVITIVVSDQHRGSATRTFQLQVNAAAG